MPNDIQTVTVPGNDAIAELEKLRKDYVHTGLYPVLLGDKEDVRFNSESIRKKRPAHKIISDSLTIDTTQWFRETLEGLQEDAETDELFEGQWPDEVIGQSGLTIQNDFLTQKPKPEIIIGLFKIENPWETFAVLNWGGWNSCPHPSEHCAIHSYWYTKYGAEVASITTDVVECIVTKPPLTREDSLRLAREQYSYCADIVDQGVGSISNLAATLMTSRYWYFWWD